MKANGAPRKLYGTFRWSWRAASYVEEVMDILEIEPSGALLNTWAYGFDLAELLAKQRDVTRGEVRLD